MSACAAEQPIVESVKNVGGIEALVGTGADGSDQDRDQHRCSDALPGDVADNDEHRAVGVGDDLEEVAADGAGGVIRSLDGKEG